MANGTFEEITKLGIQNRRPDLYRFLLKIGAKRVSFRKIKLNDIKIDQGIYPREGTDWDRVEIYAEAMKNGDQFPPLITAKDPKNLLVDGNHRYYGLQKSGFTEYWAEEWDIPKDKIKLAAQALNSEPGNIETPLTGKEKKKAILEDWEDGIRDVELIAEALKTTPSYVRKVLSNAGLIKDRKQQMKERAKELREQGLSYREIAKKLEEEFGEKVTHPTIINWTDGKSITEVKNLPPSTTTSVRSVLDNPERLIEQEEKELLEAEETEKSSEDYAKFEDTDIPLATIEYWVGECRAYVETGSDPKEAMELAGVPEHLRKYVAKKLVGFKNHLHQEEERRFKAELGPVDSRRRDIMLKVHQLVSLIQEIEHKLKELDAVYMREEGNTPEARKFQRDQYIRDRILFVMVRGGWEKAEWFREITKWWVRYVLHPEYAKEWIQDIKEQAKLTPEEWEEISRKFYEEKLASEAELNWLKFCESLGIPVPKEYGGIK